MGNKLKRKNCAFLTQL